MSDPNENFLVKQQKYRAQRIDHDYHKKSHPWRRWMRILTFLLPLGAIAALATVTFVKNDHQIYEPGPVSNRHIWFNHRCEDCHERTNGTFGVVTNQKCRACHDGSLHNTNQVCPNGEKLIRNEIISPTGNGKNAAETKVTFEEPRCASCHTEHKGNQQLVQMNDNHCTQCHADLKLKDGAATTYAKSITSFLDGHQDWRVLRADAKKPAGNDPTKLRFNHSKHMKQTYDPYSKYGARTMECVDCHKTSDSNLATMRDESTRLTEFDQLFKPNEREAFFDGIAEKAEAGGVVKYKLTRQDIRKLSVETLSTDSFDRLLRKAGNNPANVKATFESAILNIIRERFGNTAASGQNRYMVPVSYERNCASECHKHEIKANGIIVPHGPADAARDFLKNALYPETVKATLASGSLSDADKAKMKIIAKYRDVLAKAIGKPLPPAKADADKLLSDAIKPDDEKMFETFKTTVGGDDEAAKLLDGVDADKLKGYDKLKGKKKEKFDEELADALQKLVSSYVDDKPISAATIDTAVNAKLKEGLDKIFGKADDVRNKNERGACLFCHEPTERKAVTPEEDVVVAATNIPARWLNHAVFNHETHRVVECESCHAAARTSEKTTDVLLPGIVSCQRCHNQKDARMDCIECHIYHDKTHQLEDRSIPIEDLMSKGAAGVKMKDPGTGPKQADEAPPKTEPAPKPAETTAPAKPAEKK